MRCLLLVFLTAVLALAACDDDPVQQNATLPDCPAGQRRVVFRLDGGLDVTRCAEFDTLIASDSLSCTVAVWSAPANRRHDEGFRFEVSAADTTSPCGRAYFFGVTQNSVGGYTFFDGLVRRPFDSGIGPFATGTYEIINYQQTLVGIGHFEFWE